MKCCCSSFSRNFWKSLVNGFNNHDNKRSILLLPLSEWLIQIRANLTPIYIHFLVFIQENKRLYLQLLDIELGACPVSEEKVEEVFDLVKNSELDTEVKQGFSQRRIEFLEDFSADVTKIMVAQENHAKLYKGKSALIPLSGRKRSQELDR